MARIRYFWLRRTTILFQLDYKKETDFDLLCEIIRENLDSKEFFINKAIGWSVATIRPHRPQSGDKVRQVHTAASAKPAGSDETSGRIREVTVTYQVTVTYRAITYRSMSTRFCIEFAISPNFFFMYSITSGCS